MASCTPYFRALFARWSEPDKNVFSIPDISSDMMELIIEFAYTGSVNVTESNAQRLFMAADYLNIVTLVQICCNFFEKTLCPDNCVGIWQFTKTYHAPELHLKAFHYVLSHFEEVAFGEEFLQLSAQDVIDIISSDDLNVRQEAAVFEAIIRWITHEPQEREGYAAFLLSEVRLSMMPTEYIQSHVLSNKLVTDNLACQAMVSEVIEYKDIFLGRPRLPSAVLLAIGGWSNSGPTNEIEAFDIRANHWMNTTNFLELPRAHHGAAYLGGYVYCVGGSDQVEQFNSVRRFDLSTQMWQEVAPMHYRRCFVSVTVLNWCIYAMGGYDGHTRLSSAEFYQPETNQWLEIAPMHEQRSDASCTALNGQIYICGGFNGSEYLQTAECYNPETNQWTLISPMSSRRSGVGVIAYDNHVYAVGGFDGTDRLQTAEVYNPHTNTWHNVSSMMTPRSSFGIEVVEDRLFVFGGFDGFSTTSNVEYYDSETNEWSEACDMDVGRSALSCCVLSGLPNMADYTIPRDFLQIRQPDREDMYLEENLV
ncbi:kelch-like protein 10 [Parambassis ranga]|uniref:Kelch-like protein 10 n=1 Tax=Parambassis ranga TaxID=210632 RepID=A0A6P7JMG5_9TELE|nr:kelch-like protein 10 [Parambassis ranga]